MKLGNSKVSPKSSSLVSIKNLFAAAFLTVLLVVFACYILQEFNIWVTAAIILLAFFGFVLIGYYTSDSFGVKVKSCDEYNPDDENEQSVPNSQSMVDRDISSILNDSHCDSSILAGFATDSYTWYQSPNEVELFVFLKGEDVINLKSRDINVEISKFHLKVSAITAKGTSVVLLEGMLYAEVLPEESSWQIEDVDVSGRAGGRSVWISLYKRFSTTRTQHWRSVVTTNSRDNSASKSLASSDATESVFSKDIKKSE